MIQDVGCNDVSNVDTLCTMGGEVASRFSIIILPIQSLSKNYIKLRVNGSYHSAKTTTGTFLLVTVRNEATKVIFLYLCVCPQGGLPQCMLGYHPLPEQTPPLPPGTSHLSSRRLLLRTARILLECILVTIYF